MICATDCTEVKCLAAPGEAATTANLILGTVAISTAHTVYVYEEHTNKTYAENFTSSLAGVLTVNLLDYGLIWNPHGIYYIWATTANDNMVDKVNISISAVNYTCFIATFERTFVNGLVSCPTSQTLEIA